MIDRFEELRQNKPAMLEFFASKGWEIFFKWGSEQVAADFEKAIRGAGVEEREAARLTGLAKEELMRLPFFLADQAGLNTADAASENPPTTA